MWAPIKLTNHWRKRLEQVQNMLRHVSGLPFKNLKPPQIVQSAENLHVCMLYFSNICYKLSWPNDLEDIKSEVITTTPHI